MSPTETQIKAAMEQRIPFSTYLSVRNKIELVEYIDSQTEDPTLEEEDELSITDFVNEAIENHLLIKRKNRADRTRARQARQTLKERNP